MRDDAARMPPRVIFGRAVPPGQDERVARTLPSTWRSCDLGDDAWCPARSGHDIGPADVRPLDPAGALEHALIWT
jgi:hypothetical protein